MERERYDVVVVGAGAAGCVLAARLSEDAGRRVCLVEAGPDYGYLAEGRWPADLLDGTDCAWSHDWGFGTDPSARVVGGCSAHNGCLAVRGTLADYDEWAAATGDADWGAAAMAPRLARAAQACGVRAFADDELSEFSRAFRAAAGAAGLPALAEVDGPELEGHGLFRVNRRGRTRWHAALAYLEPARTRPNLALRADCLADRVVIAGGRARGVLLRRAGRDELLIEADEVVLTANAYGTPAILLRSGVGAAAELAALGIEVAADVPAVGRNLADHPVAHLRVAPTPALAAALAERDGRGALTHLQAVAKARSARCPPGTYDLQVCANLGWELDGYGRRTGVHRLSLMVVLQRGHDTGSVRLRSADPALLPSIDRGLFAGGDGYDLAALLDGLALARRLAAQRPLAEVLARELAPAPDCTGEALAGYVRDTASALYHPTGTARLGRPDALAAVADADGRVRGVGGLRVADASALPTVPRANTHLSVLAFAEGMAERLRRA